MYNYIVHTRRLNDKSLPHGEMIFNIHVSISLDAASRAGADRSQLRDAQDPAGSPVACHYSIQTGSQVVT